MKKITVLLLAITLLLGLAACTSSSPSPSAPATQPPASAPAASEPAGNAPDASGDPKVTLTYAEVNPEDSLMGKTAQEFKKQVETLSGGSITVNIQASAVLGAEGDVLETMTGGGGTIDMARISGMSLKSFSGINVTNLMGVPYMFSSREHFWAVTGSDVGAAILNECHDVGLGIRGMYFVEEGFRHFFFKNEIKGIEDLKGKKIRISTDSTSVGMVRGLGGADTTIAFNELYSSLQTGVVDGAEQPIVNYLSNKFNEVAPYMILDGHTLGCGMVIMTDAAWDKLTDAQKECVRLAGEAASNFNRENSSSAEESARTDLEAAGASFIPVDDKQPWRDACATIIAEVTAGLEEYTDKIAALE